MPAPGKEPPLTEGVLGRDVRKHLPNLLKTLLRFDRTGNLSVNADALQGSGADEVACTSIIAVITLVDHALSTGGAMKKAAERATFSIVLAPEQENELFSQEAAVERAIHVLQRALDGELLDGDKLKLADDDHSAPTTEVLVSNQESADHAVAVMKGLFLKASAKPEAAPKPGDQEAHALLQGAGAHAPLHEFGAGREVTFAESGTQTTDVPPLVGNPLPPAPENPVPAPPSHLSSSHAPPGQQDPPLPEQSKGDAPARKHGTNPTLASLSPQQQSQTPSRSPNHSPLGVHPRKRFEPKFAGVGKAAGGAAGGGQIRSEPQATLLGEKVSGAGPVGDEHAPGDLGAQSNALLPIQQKSPERDIPEQEALSLVQQDALLPIQL